MLQSLHMFVLCAKHLSFSKVAELCFTTQPSVSKYISSLEAELGGALFLRGSRKLEITGFGMALLPYAQGILSSEEELREFVHQYHNGQIERPIILGISDVISDTPSDNLLIPISQATRIFSDSNEGKKIQVAHFAESQLRDMLRSERIDLALVAVNNNHLPDEIKSEFNYLRLDEAEHSMLYSPNLGEFADAQELFERIDSLLCVSDQVAMSVAYDYCRMVKVPLRIVPCESWHDAVLRTVNGQGATILNSSNSKIAENCGLKMIDLSEYGITSSVVLLWKKGRDYLVRDYATLLRNCINQ